jgi:hypothetical protein
MGREIEGSAPVLKEFHPLVGLRTIGNYVKGKVLEHGVTTKNNPYVTLELIDLEGSTTKSMSKGVYAEAEVNIGDTVQLIGTVKDLKDKLPKLPVGSIATITFEKTTKVSKGTMKNFKVIVED